MKLKEGDLVRFLKDCGYSGKSADGQELSAAARALMDIQMEQNVDYAGSLAGHAQGLIDMEGKSVLVTDSPTIIKPEAGEFPTIQAMLLNMFGEVQLPFFKRGSSLPMSPSRLERTVSYDYAPGAILPPTSSAPAQALVVLTQATYPGTCDFPDGTTFQYDYDEDSRLTEEIDGKGNTLVTNTYGTKALGTEYCVMGQTMNGASDEFDYLALEGWMNSGTTDFDGQSSGYTTDSNGNELQKEVSTSGFHTGEPVHYLTNYTYDTNGHMTQETDPSGNGTSWTYDSGGLGNVLTVTKFSPSGATVDGSMGTQSLTALTTNTYETRFNQIATVTDPNGRTTTYDYGDDTSSPTGNLLSITYPTTAAGTAVESFTYNSLGQVLTDTAPDGTVTKNTYDDATGYLTQVVKDYGTGKLNATTQYTYDAYGNVASVTDPDGHTVTTTYNALGLVTEIDGASGQVEKRTYDENQNLVDDLKQAPGSGVWEKTENVYNAYQQVTETDVYTDDTHFVKTVYTYDGNGNRTSVKDPLGHVVTTAYDERGKPYLVTDAASYTTQLDYDPNGNTVKLTDELGHVTTYAYDGLDKLEKKTFPDSSYQTWTYDTNGNITSLLTTAGNTITQTYDCRNRMLTQSYGSSTITNVYDILGRVLTSTEGGTALTYTYDNLGRNVTFTDQAGRESTYTYDLAGNRTSTAYPTGVTVKRCHDASNRVTKLKDGSDATQATYSYDLLDRVTGLNLANSTSVAYSYDLLNRLGYVNNTLTSGNRNYSYVYDDASRVTSTTEPRGTIASGYTDRNEVNSITEPSGSPFADQSFVYDAGYNRSSWTLGTTTKTYTANNLNEYTAVGSATPTWNTDGGLATFHGNTYTYDALMRLTEVDNSLGKYLFSYDPLGRRVKKVCENTEGTVLSTTCYHYDGSEVAVEYQPSTTWTYYLGLGIDQVVMRTDGTNKQWYYRDGHGSTSAVADNSGNLLEAYEYTAQGHFQITNASGTVLTGTAIANDITYTGREYDAQTGNFFYRARYYNPELGRFISRDPLSGAEFSQGTNLYAYCGNNFLNATDPNGTWEVTITGAWGGGASINFGYNNGTFNAGFTGGAGEGLSVTVDPRNDASYTDSSVAVTATGDIGLGEAASAGFNTSAGLNAGNGVGGDPKLDLSVGGDLSLGDAAGSSAIGGDISTGTDGKPTVTAGGGFTIGESVLIGIHTNIGFKKHCPTEK